MSTQMVSGKPTYRHTIIIEIHKRVAWSYIQHAQAASSSADNGSAHAAATKAEEDMENRANMNI